MVGVNTAAVGWRLNPSGWEIENAAKSFPSVVAEISAESCKLGVAPISRWMNPVVVPALLRRVVSRDSFRLPIVAARNLVGEFASKEFEAPGAKFSRGFVA